MVKECKRCGATKNPDKCVTQIVECDGKRHPPVLYGDEREGWLIAGRLPLPRCPDCKVLVKTPHHAGCVEEVCPHCNHKAATCGCRMKVIETKP